MLIRYFTLLLCLAAILSVTASAEEDLGGGPLLACDKNGYIQAWANDGEIVIRLENLERVPRSSRGRVIDDVRRAAEVWRTKGGPEIRIVTGSRRSVASSWGDGISSLMIVRPDGKCGSVDLQAGTRGACLGTGFRGVTRIRSVPVANGRAQIVEADVLVSSGVINSSEMVEVIAHEFGHVLGLTHPVSDIRQSIMISGHHPPTPTNLDLDLIKKVYSAGTARLQRFCAPAEAVARKE